MAGDEELSGRSVRLGLSKYLTVSDHGLMNRNVILDNFQTVTYAGDDEFKAVLYFLVH